MAAIVTQTEVDDKAVLQLLDGTAPQALIVNSDDTATVHVTDASRGTQYVPLAPGKGILWPAKTAAFATAETGQSAVVLTVIGGGGMFPSAAEIAAHIGTVGITLGPGSVVEIGNGVTIASQPPIDIASQPPVDIASQPPVVVGNDVSIAGAASTATQDAGIPNFSARNVSASAAVTATLTAVSSLPGGNVVVLPAVIGVRYELHVVSMTAQTNSNTSNAVATASIEDATTGQQIAQATVLATSAAGDVAQATVTLDLQGVTLPTGHGVRFRLSNNGVSFGAGFTTSVALNALTYQKVT